MCWRPTQRNALVKGYRASLVTMNEDCVRAFTSFSVIQTCPSASKGWSVLLNVRPRALSWDSPPRGMGAPSMVSSLTTVSSPAVAKSCGSTVKKDEDGIVHFSTNKQTNKNKTNKMFFFFPIQTRRDRRERRAVIGSLISLKGVRCGYD